MRTAAALILLAASGSAALAQSAAPPSPAGRYALDETACAADDIFLTMAEDRIDFPVFSCSAVQYDQLQDSGGVEIYEVYGDCIAEGETQEYPQRFGVVKDGDRLQVRWSDGTESAVMLSCGAVQAAP